MNTTEKTKDLAKRIDSLVIKSGIAEAVKEIAVEYFAFYDLLDAAFDAENDDLVAELDAKQSVLKIQIEAIITDMIPAEAKPVEPILLKNLVASAIDLAIR